MSKVWVFLGMAAVTYVSRVTLLLAVGRDLPPTMRRWLRFVPAAVLAALITPSGLAPNGVLQLGARGAALIVGAVVAWRTRDALPTVAAGLLAFWLLRAFGA